MPETVAIEQPGQPKVIKPTGPAKPTADELAASQQAAKDILKQSRAKHDVMGEPIPEKPKPLRGEDGKFTSSKEETPAQATEGTAGAKDGSPAPESEPSKPKVDPKEYESAVKVLLRDGTLDADELAAMDPAKVISKAEKAKKRHKDIDLDHQTGQNAVKELEAARAKIAELEKSKPNPAHQEASTSTGEPAPDLAKLAEPISAKLKAVLGDDVSLDAEFKALLEPIFKTVEAERTNARKGLETATEKFQAQLDVVLDRDARPDVEAKFGKVEGFSWNDVRESASELMKAGLATDRSQALMSAAAMKYGIAAAEQAAKAAKVIDKAKTNGQPFSGTQVSPSTKAAPTENPQKTFLRLRRAGHSVDEANAMIGNG